MGNVQTPTATLARLSKASAREVMREHSNVKFLPDAVLCTRTLRTFWPFVLQKYILRIYNKQFLVSKIQVEFSFPYFYSSILLPHK